MKKLHLLLLFLFTVSAVSCQEKLSEPDRPSKLREGRIGIRAEAGTLTFFDKGTGSRFVPMGYNYTHLQDFSYKGLTLKGHSTFIKDYYEAQISENVLAKLQAAGYNTVRIFLNPAAISTEKNVLDPDYIQNLTDFIKKAANHELSVIITTDMIPVAFFGGNPRTEEDLVWLNTQYISQEYVDLEIGFWQLLIDEFRAKSVPLEAVLSYEIRNEFIFHPAHKPFSEKSGTVRHSNGKSYDMSRETDRNALADASFDYWSAAVRKGIREKDPEALVSVGFFAPEPVGKPSKVALSSSELDFVDLHMYPETAKLDEYADYFGLKTGQKKLVIMGEFGYLEQKNRSLEELKNGLLSWKNEAASAYGIDAWLLWTWDTGIGSPLSVPDKNEVIFKGFSPGE